MSTYESQTARDAQAANYGEASYWAYLDKSAKEKHTYFMQRGDIAQAQQMLTRSLAQDLIGNDGI